MSDLSPTWSLTAYFPTFGGPEYQTFIHQLQADLKSASAAVETTVPLDDSNHDGWASHFATAEDIGARLGHVGSYLGCLGAADAANEDYQAAEAALASLQAEFAKLMTLLKHGLSQCSDESFEVFLKNASLADATHELTRLRTSARFQMESSAEALAADLGVDGISAWGRLYDTVSGKMTFEMKWPDGRTETTPMSQRRALLTHHDRRVRAAAFHAGNTVWAAHEDVMGAALNAIAGTRLTLYSRRGQNHFLDAPFHDASVSRATIDAMFAAIDANLDVPRRLLGLNARLQGTAGIAWFDQDAPQLPNTLPELSWERAVALCDQAFGDHYPHLQSYLRSMIKNRWVENEQRPNKRAGAFATGSSVINEERIFMTFGGTMSDVTTLAHEVGHTWHSHLLTALRPCAQTYPMTLAETASTFAESILADGLMADPGLDEDQRAFLLEGSLSHAPSFLLNIPVRFKFESRFYEERAAGTVPVSRIKQLMTEAQLDVFGDTLDPARVDPWFWASKLHFFITELSFYNFPYTFGYLLSSALFQEFKREGPAFLKRYETFLSLTGRATCEDVVQQALGRDIREEAFWAETIRGLTPRIDAYAAVVARKLGAPS